MKEFGVYLYRAMLTALLCIIGVWSSTSFVSAQGDSAKASYQEMRSEMEAEASKIIEKEISDKKKSQVSEEEQAFTLVSYDIENAIPVCYLESDATMIADYKTQNEDFSKLIKWEGDWYIPAKTMTGNLAHICVRKIDQEYRVAGVFLDDIDVYMADKMDEIWSIVEAEFGDRAAVLNVISVPFYSMNLLYVQDMDGEEFVLPYDSKNADVLDNIQAKAGEVYKVSDFISNMDKTYEEYTRQELEELSEQMKDMLGGSIEPKLRPLEDRQQASGGNPILWIGIAIMACLLVGVVVLVSQMKRNKGGIYEKA